MKPGPWININRRTMTALGVGILVTLMSTPLVSAQVKEEWVARYNGPGNSYDNARAIALDNFGNIYVTGASMSAASSYDYATIKYDSTGNELWVRPYNGGASGPDESRAIATDNEGNVYVTGCSAGLGADDDYATVAYDSAGNQLWVARYDGPDNGDDCAGAIAVDEDRNVYVTGASCPGSELQPDCATVKYDSEGNQVWVMRYDGPANGADSASNIALDEDGNVYIAGTVCSESLDPYACADSDYITIKYDSAGNQLWVKVYNGWHNDYASAMTLDHDGNIYVTGGSISSISYEDYATVKYDATGNELWVARYKGPGNGPDATQDITTDNDGNVYVTGVSYGEGTGFDYATIKYDPAGNELWVRRYSGPGYEQAKALALDNVGNVYVTGSAGVSVSSDRDCLTVKYDTNGNELWAARLNGEANGMDLAHDIVVDPDGNAYITASSHSLGTGLDYVTVKYVPNTLPVPDAGGPYPPNMSAPEGSLITFSASASVDPDGDSLQYRWDFDTNGVWDTDWSDDPEAKHTYYDNYPRLVATVEVYDGDLNGGVTDTATVNVINVAPTASIDLVEALFPQLMVNGKLKFTGSFTDPGTLDTHTVQWDFGDGHTETSSPVAEHSYEAGGDYQVTLTVTDDDGGVGTAEKMITVVMVKEAVEKLLSEMVEDVDHIPGGLKNSLSKKLENAINSSLKENVIAGANQLQAFMNEVEAQKDKKLTRLQADGLVEVAQLLIGSINR